MDQEKVRGIHEASLRILERTGMRFLHPDAIEILKEHGVEVDGNGVAHFTAEQVMEWVGKVPATADLYAADPTYNVSIGEDRSYNAPACTAVQLKEPDGRRRLASLDEFVKIIKLYEGNPAYSVNGGLPLQPAGIPTDWSTLLLHYVSLLHTNKSMWTCTGNYEQMEAVIDLTCARFDITKEELTAHPRVMAIVNPLSPLEFDIKMTETMLTYGKYHQPITIAPASMAGTTAPMTLAGTIALTNAEILGTIVVAQMANPGTPLIYGSASTTADMRTGAIAIGAPEGALCYGYAGQMAKFYGIPSRAGGSLTDAKKVDAQSGYEAMMNYYTCRKNGVNLIYHSAGILNSYLDFSFEQMIVDFEIVDYVERIMRDITVDEENIPEDLIDEVGPGGSFLMEDHTMEHCHSEALLPFISARGSVTDPDSALERNIAARIDSLVDAYVKPEVADDAVEEMRKVLRAHGIEEELIAKLDAC